MLQMQHGQLNCHQRLQNLQSTASAILRNSFQYPLSNCQNLNGGKFNNIASANPLLAEKLAATPNGIKQEPLSNDYADSSLGYENASIMQRIGDIGDKQDGNSKGRIFLNIIKGKKV